MQIPGPAAKFLVLYVWGPWNLHFVKVLGSQIWDPLLESTLLKRRPSRSLPQALINLDMASLSLVFNYTKVRNVTSSVHPVSK